MEYLYKGWLKIYKKKIGNREFEILEDKDAAGALVEDAEGRFLLVRQYRPALDRESLEIPAGCLDKEGLSAAEIMIEELEEEANLRIDINDLELMIDTCPQIGVSKGSYKLFYCKYNKKGQDKKISDDEDVTEAIWLSPEEFLKSIENREIVDVKSQLAYYMIMNKKKTHS